MTSEDLPHESGIKTFRIPTIIRNEWSEDLPHKSGIKTKPGTFESGLSSVGRLAPQIGD